jgi:hypothetical protein
MTPTPIVTDLPTQDILLNASSLAKTNCELAYHNMVVNGLQSVEEADVLTFGKAIHRYAEQRSKGMSAINALQEVMRDYPVINGGLLADACTSMPPPNIPHYVDRDNIPYLEHYFKVFWQSRVRNGKQYNIYICGTIDRIELFSDGAVRIVDYKSARSYKWNEVFEAYRVSVQMRFYLWAAYKFGTQIFDLTISNETTRNNMFAQIYGVFLSSKPVAWRMGPPIQLTATDLMDFESDLIYQLDKTILPAWDDPRPTGMLNNACKYCDFRVLCHAGSQTEEEQALARFKKVPYNPQHIR